MVEKQLLEIKCGLLDSKKYTIEIIRNIKNIFRSNFDVTKYSLYSWGSVARREMGPYSDLDLVIIGSNPKIKEVQRFINLVKEKYPNNNLDLLNAHSVFKFHKIAKIDGTDNQAKIFIKKEIGVQNFVKSHFCDLEELWHIYLNLEYVYPVLFKKTNLKFSPYFIKYFNFAVLISNYLGCDKQDLHSVLKFLIKKKHIKKKHFNLFLNTYSELLGLRNKYQEINLSGNCEINYNLISKKLKQNKKTINKKLTDISKTAEKLYLLLKNILFLEIKKELSDEELYFLNYILNHRNSNDSVIRKIIFNNNYYLVLLLTYVTFNPLVLENLRGQNLKNWYILYGIANNPFSSKITLYRLMVPKIKERKIVGNFYVNYAWRNIYLYVAKNKNADLKIKQHILNYKNAREMDIIAANKIK
ncbi:MAG: nucleotidyltransferase domain-containing protein [Candidatus ainarchaeum sp.]|nr:nucleotidyltransferase domain-containing protein [Candidatus ainarchaeum sp.]MDD3976427.1 nucleotidyltransferase domain-containing protein [Candidatus ainarchaeum sp.]